VEKSADTRLDWEPAKDSIFYGESQEEFLTCFAGMGAEVDGVNPLEMLRVQLLAAELNVYYFDDEFDTLTLRGSGHLRDYC
jgi:hypothetical protein